MFHRSQFVITRLVALGSFTRLSIGATSHRFCTNSRALCGPMEYSIQRSISGPVKYLLFLTSLVFGVFIQGCSSSGAPSPAQTPAAQSAYIGQSASFIVGASGAAPLTYQWQLGGNNILGATSATYTTPALTAADNGNSYAVNVSNSAGSVTSKAAALTVAAQAPQITLQPTAATIQIGQTATFSVQAVGTIPLSYQWLRSGTAISGATSNSYSLSNAQLADSGITFAVRVSNVAGTVTSSAATLTVTDVPVAITTQPMGGTFFVGESTTMRVAANGTLPSYQWTKNGVNIAGANGTSYTTPTFTTANDKDSYAVVVSNLTNSVTSAAATIRVGPFATVYTTEQGAQLNLYAWPGEKMAILSASNTLSPTVMRSWLTAADGTWNYYATATGSVPSLNFNYNGLATIAEVQNTCGAGCTYIGATGMEIEDPYFSWMPDGIPFKVYDQIMFYEMGRSFWLFEKQLGYRSPGNSACLQTGFAILMRFRSIAAQNYQGAYNGFYSTPVTQAQITSAINNYDNLLSSNAGLIDYYAANTSDTWSNTFYTNTFTDPNGGCADLFASLIQRLAQDNGGETYIQDIWKEILKLPAATTDQQAADNFVLAASSAGKVNLTGHFINVWRWPVSAAAQQTAQSEWGNPVP